MHKQRPSSSPYPKPSSGSRRPLHAANGNQTSFVFDASGNPSTALSQAAFDNITQCFVATPPYCPPDDYLSPRELVSSPSPEPGPSRAPRNKSYDDAPQIQDCYRVFDQYHDQYGYQLMKHYAGVDATIRLQVASAYARHLRVYGQPSR
jgi:hypothetical protein